MTWAIFDNLYASLRDDKDDYVNHVGAAFTSGFLFKSTIGLRQAMTSGLLLSSVVLSYKGISEFLLKTPSPEKLSSPATQP
jgi:import inner membrane translocase subunit TIM23